MTDDMTEAMTDLRDAVDVGFLLVCTALVFWEQAGFALLEAGSVRARNVSNILFKNLMDVSLGAVVFAAIGYGLAFGRSASGVAGTTAFFLGSLSTSRDYALFAWHWSFAATAATTVSGCVAERIDTVAYLVCATLITGVVYAVPVHWVWSDDGVFSVWNASTVTKTGVIDFAGSGLVHMVGGVAGLVGSVMLGPRIGRFSTESFEASVAAKFAVATPRARLKDHEGRADALQGFKGHNATLTALGVYCLWFGWFGFNAGCAGGLADGKAEVAALAVLNTALAPPCGAIVALGLAKARTGHWSLPATISGLLAGLVGITGPCGVVGGGDAAAIGAVSGLVYHVSAIVLDRACVDDPVDAIAIHAFPGAWGVLASGLFARSDRLDDAGLDYATRGLFVGGAAGQLGVQVLGVFAIFAWTCAASALAFVVGGAVARACGNPGLRVSARDELRGLDLAKHGGAGLQVFAADVAVALRLPRDDNAPDASDRLAALCAGLVQIPGDDRDDKPMIALRDPDDEGKAGPS